LIDAERVDFLLIPTRDFERATRFYGDTLGLPRSNDSSAWAEFETGNLTLAIPNPEHVPMEFKPLPPAAVALRVPDVAEARAKLEGAGVEFGGDVIDSGVCHMAFFEDPDGNGLMLHRRYAPQD